MPCFHPLDGYKSKLLNPSGKRSIVFNKRDAYVDLTVQVPCGQCIGCRLERARQWAIRCVLESKLHDQNSFITLTYKDQPANNSLDVKHFQDFMKRLRFKYTGQTIRFFHCGEYGENNGRPHYHAILFGLDFSDKQLWKEQNGQKYYVSETLGTKLRDGKIYSTGEGIWDLGNSIIGDVTFESASYVARYVTKKITGANAPEHYGLRKPEYTTMSRRPGIGKPWFDKYKTDVYPDDHIVLRGKEMKPPKFFDQQLEKLSQAEYLKLKHQRKEAAKLHADDQTFPRRKDREEILISKFEKLKRSYESDEQS